MVAARVSWAAMLALAVLLIFDPSRRAEASRSTEPRAVTARAGSLRVLTYNIAGLPEGISRSRPSINVPLIAPFLSNYDVVLMQEDFAFQTELRRGVRLPYHSRVHQRRTLLDFGDGLSRFASKPFRELLRQAWRRCHGYFDSGSDCLAAKGFSLARHRIAPRVEIDIYNLHLDAGRSREDFSARAAQLEQLAGAILDQSSGRAVIVGGDTNLWGQDVTLLKLLEEKTALQDSCQVVRCVEPARIDRLLFRSSALLQLELESWIIDRRFVDSNRRPLSDHLAVAVELSWRLKR